AVHGGGAAEVVAGTADLRGPEGFTVLAIEGEDVGLAILVAHGEDAVAGDGDAGVAGADAGALPEQFGSVLGPLFEEALVGRDVIEFRPPEARPLALGV